MKGGYDAQLKEQEPKGKRAWRAFSEEFKAGAVQLVRESTPRRHASAYLRRSSGLITPRHCGAPHEQGKS